MPANQYLKSSPTSISKREHETAELISAIIDEQNRNGPTKNGQVMLKKERRKLKITRQIRSEGGATPGKAKDARGLLKLNRMKHDLARNQKGQPLYSTEQYTASRTVYFDTALEMKEILEDLRNRNPEAFNAICNQFADCMAMAQSETMEQFESLRYEYERNQIVNSQKLAQKRLLEHKVRCLITQETNDKIAAIQALVSTRPKEIASELIKFFGVTPPLAVMQQFYRNEGTIKRFWKSFMTPWKDMKMMLQLLQFEQAHDDSICMREWLNSLHAISQNEKVYLMEAVKTGKLKRSEAELVQRFTSYDEAQKVWRKRQDGEEYIVTPSRPPSFGKQKDRQIYKEIRIHITNSSKKIHK